MKRKTFGVCVLVPMGFSLMVFCCLGVQEREAAGLTATDLPPTLVESAVRVIGGDSTQWEIISEKWPPSNSDTVVFLVGEHLKSYVACIDTNHQWVPLNCEAGITKISDLLKRRFGETKHFYQGKQLLTFLDEFLFLRRGVDGVVASKSFGEQESVGSCSWMAGKETNRAVFLNYCTDPVVKTQGQDVEIQFNFFNPWGGVERWNLRGRFTGFLDITNAVGNVLKENGTFYYPLER